MSELSQVVPTATAEVLSDALFSQLKSTDIFASMKDEDLRCLSGLEERTLGKDEVLAQQGEAAHFFWVLLHGEIRVAQTQPNGSELTLATIPPGSAFGELPLLANIPNAATISAVNECHLVQINEDAFWNLMKSCPEVRRAILGNMAKRFQKLQSMTVQQEKMASLGTLAAGLMHELNNPGAAARRAASQLRSNLTRMHELTAKFSKTEMDTLQKECIFELQEHALSMKQPIVMS